MIRSEMEKSSAFLSPERTTAAIESALRRRAQRTQSFSRSKPQGEAEISGQPRRLDSGGPRRLGPSQDSPYAQRRRPSQASKSKHGQTRKPPPKPTQTATTVQVDDVDLSIFEGAYAPTFIGAAQTYSDPQSLFGSAFSAKDATVIAETGKRFVVPTSRIDSFRESKYDAYIKAAPEDFGALPDEIGPLRVAQRTLSHQQHYSLPAKVGTLNLLARITPKTSTHTKAS
ncbi:hypothetical protein CPB83DRAFT_848012 [Crepidotus variabilis]|uniref:Uncharacterized protein n=1 Tax=Crepidotus variabilis TaxID=179855 RepID=A0A9P6EMU7_9AGAR|nr:hypothetical protein CPB83DRAFT_848012 [Crepidotus variabilis]